MSVVIPTRNRWPLLSRAIASALAQRHVDFEVVVVDDGSTDETEARLAALDDARVRTIRLSGGSGARARNAGIAGAAGRWIAFLDDDDVWSPDKLRTQLDRAELSGAGFVYSRAVHLREPGEVVRMHALPQPGELARELLVANVIPAGASNVMVRTPLLAELGGFDEEFDHLADWDLWIRLAREAPAAACERCSWATSSTRATATSSRATRSPPSSSGSSPSTERQRGRGGRARQLPARARNRARLPPRGTPPRRGSDLPALGHRRPQRGNAVRAPAALLGEGFRDRFARDTRIPVGEVWWLLDVWHPDWRPDQQALAVAAHPVGETS